MPRRRPTRPPARRATRPPAARPRRRRWPWKANPTTPRAATRCQLATRRRSRAGAAATAGPVLGEQGAAPPAPGARESGPLAASASSAAVTIAQADTSAAPAPSDTPAPPVEGGGSAASDRIAEWMPERPDSLADVSEILRRGLAEMRDELDRGDVPPEHPRPRAPVGRRTGGPGIPIRARGSLPARPRRAAGRGDGGRVVSRGGGETPGRCPDPPRRYARQRRWRRRGTRRGPGLVESSGQVRATPWRWRAPSS